jgi:hypothetical protein
MSSFNYERIPIRIGSNLPGILWPRQTTALGRKLFPSAEVIAYMRANVATILTFGVMSPPVAIAIMLSIFISIQRWRMYIGRFLVLSSVGTDSLSGSRSSPGSILEPDATINAMVADIIDVNDRIISTEMVNFPKSDVKMAFKPELENKSEDADSKILTVEHCVALEAAIFNSSSGQIACGILIVFACTPFYLGVILDMAGDDAGFENSTWVFIVILGWVLIISLAVPLFVNHFWGLKNISHVQNII